MNRSDIINLYFYLPNRYIYIHNLYNPVNEEEVNTSILSLKYRLTKHLNKKYIPWGDFNFYYEAWREPMAPKTLIERSKKLLIVT